MSTRRLAATVAVMAVIAMALAALTPGTGQLRAAVLGPQQMADAVGPEAVVLAWAALLGWAVWAWGALGVALTAASVIPGAVGGAARLGLRLLLPATARRSAAVALGVGLGLSAPVLWATALPVVAPASATTDAPAAPVPDWPASERAESDPPAPPDWPTGPAAAPATPSQHVVVPGDCLWDIAAAELRQHTGSGPTDADVALAVRAWADRNAGVIGPDPDLLFPGQVLTPPDRTDPESTP